MLEVGITNHGLPHGDVLHLRRVMEVVDTGLDGCGNRKDHVWKDNQEAFVAGSVLKSH